MREITKTSTEWLTDEELRIKLKMCKSKFYKLLKEGPDRARYGGRVDDFRLIACRRLDRTRLWSLSSYEAWCRGEM